MVVLSNGMVADQGTPEELINTGTIIRSVDNSKARDIYLKLG